MSEGTDWKERLVKMLDLSPKHSEKNLMRWVESSAAPRPMLPYKYERITMSAKADLDLFVSSQNRPMCYACIEKDPSGLVMTVASLLTQLEQPFKDEAPFGRIICFSCGLDESLMLPNYVEEYAKRRGKQAEADSSYAIAGSMFGKSVTYAEIASDPVLRKQYMEAMQNNYMRNTVLSGMTSTLLGTDPAQNSLAGLNTPTQSVDVQKATEKQGYMEALRQRLLGTKY